MKSAFLLLGPWTLYHAIFDSLDRTGVWKTLIFWVCPAVLWMAAWSREVPKKWIWVVALVTLECLIAPQAHYMIGMLPFLCLMAAMYMQDWRPPCWAHRVTIVLLAFTVIRMGFVLVRPFGLLWMRPYGIADNTYYSEQIDKSGVERPVWTNWPAIYFIEGWTVPGNDFIAQINDGVNIDWNKTPYDAVKNRVYFRHDHDYKDTNINGWKLKTVTLTRGQFTEMRIYQRSVRRETPTSS